MAQPAEMLLAWTSKGFGRPMSAQNTDENSIADELRAIFRASRDHRDRDSRIALFDSLADLERSMVLSGAPESFLRRVAECRFLAGILRNSVSPVHHQAMRATRRIWTAPLEAIEAR
ncbi:hypothetical protein [Methylobacterium komagatae]